MAKKFYGQDMQGKQWLQELASPPGHVAADERRLFYNKASETLYFGNSSAFIEIIPRTDADVELLVTFEALDANGDVGTGANQVSEGDHTHAIAAALDGFVNRTRFEWVSTSTITLEGSRYHSNGTLNQTVEWNSDITFVFGGAGSNPSSTTPVGAGIQYLYFDDPGSTTITAADLINLSTAPTWTPSKLGWYSGARRCIGGFVTDGSGFLKVFWHDGGDHFIFDRSNTVYGTAYPGTGFSTTVTFVVPSFVSRVCATIEGAPTAGDTGISLGTPYRIYIRPKGSSDSVGMLVGQGLDIAQSGSSSDRRKMSSTNTFGAGIFVNSSQQMEIRVNNADIQNTTLVQEAGWYFPKGM